MSSAASNYRDRLLRKLVSRLDLTHISSEDLKTTLAVLTAPGSFKAVQSELSVKLREEARSRKIDLRTRPLYVDSSPPNRKK